MDEIRSTVLWLFAGLLGMAGLLLVMRFGVAVGLALIVAFSTPTLAGASLRGQVVALSGLLAGFGMLWLMLFAGEALTGIALHHSVAGYALFGLVVLALGVLLGIGHLSTTQRRTRPPAVTSSARVTFSPPATGHPLARRAEPVPIELPLPSSVAYRNRR